MSLSNIIFQLLGRLSMFFPPWYLECIEYCFTVNIPVVTQPKCNVNMLYFTLYEYRQDIYHQFEIRV